MKDHICDFMHNISASYLLQFERKDFSANFESNCFHGHTQSINKCSLHVFNLKSGNPNIKLKTEKPQLYKHNGLDGYHIT